MCFRNDFFFDIKKTNFDIVNKEFIYKRQVSRAAPLMPGPNIIPPLPRSSHHVVNSIYIAPVPAIAQNVFLYTSNA